MDEAVVFRITAEVLRMRIREKEKKDGKMGM